MFHDLHKQVVFSRFLQLILQLPLIIKQFETMSDLTHCYVRGRTSLCTQASIVMYEVVHRYVRGHLLLCTRSYIVWYAGIYCYVWGRTSFGTRASIVAYEVVHGCVCGHLLLCTGSVIVKPSLVAGDFNKKLRTRANYFLTFTANHLLWSTRVLFWF